MGEQQPLDVFLVSHTHWDREWYLPAGRFRQRLVALVDDLLARVPPPGASFLLDGQAVVLEDYLAVRPERREELAGHLRDGSLEAGPWYVLADELIPSGEALIRNLLAGRAVLRALGAEPPPVLYSPDAFGHPAALPAIARGFGCALIILWRGLGGPSWAAGDSFRWSAPDGSEVLVHHLPPAGYEYASNLPAQPADAALRWRRVRSELGRRARLGVVLLLNGADHHARQHDLAAAFGALRSAIAQASDGDRLIEGRLGGFAGAVLSRAPGAELPEITGELRNSYGYTWTLQGTFGARAALKRRNAQLERLLLRDAEPWAALAARAGRPRRALLQAAWKALLRCHPHDTLCGCSADEIARAVVVRQDDVLAQAAGVRDDALLDLIGHDRVRARPAQPDWRPALVLRNAAARPREGVAEVELLAFARHVPVGPGSGSATAAVGAEYPVPAFALDGGRVPVQLLEAALRHDRIESPEHYPDDDLVHAARAVIWSEPVAGYGTLSLPVSAAPDPSARARPLPRMVQGDDRGLRNGLLELALDPSAPGLLSLRGAAGAAITPLVAFEDVGDAGDLYTHSPIPPATRQARCVDVALRHRGPLRAALDTRWEITVPESSARTGRSAGLVSIPLSLTLTLDAGAPFLRLRVRGENLARDHRLRILIGTGIPGGSVHADAAFGPVQRRPLDLPAEQTAEEMPPRTAPLHRYVSVFGTSGGVTIHSDGLAEYELLGDGAVAITLVRAVGELSRNDLPERPGHAGWPVATPEAQAPGAFEAELAVQLHGPRDDRPIDAIERVSDDVLLPLRGTTLRSALALPDPTIGLSLRGEGLAFSACKGSDDGRWTVLRCVNLLDRPASGAWRLAGPVHEARRARFDEEPGAPLAPIDGSIAFEAGAREAVTILVR